LHQYLLHQYYLLHQRCQGSQHYLDFCQYLRYLRCRWHLHCLDYQGCQQSQKSLRCHYYRQGLCYQKQIR
jgi:hypothetical protein